jgi:hypothetical protein
MKRKIVVGLVAAAAVLGMNTPAFAAGPGGAEACPNGTICLYYNSPQYGWGSFENWSPGWVPSLFNNTFAHWGNGSGYGQQVANNAASVVNNSGVTWSLCTRNAGGPYGACEQIQPGYAGVLDDFLYNNVISMHS